MHDGNEAKERRQLQPNSTHHLVTPQLLAQEVDKLGEAFLAVNLQAIEAGCSRRQRLLATVAVAPE